MDLSSNVCMQPFKMIIGDMVNEDQKDFAWSWQQIFSNMGGILATLMPFIMTLLGVSNTAKKGSLPNSVIWTFYLGAAIPVSYTHLYLHSQASKKPAKLVRRCGIL